MVSASLRSSARRPRVIPYRTINRGVTLGNPLLAQEDDWRFTRLEEEKLCPMPVAVECKPCPCWTEVTQRSEHRQADHLVEAIAGL